MTPRKLTPRQWKVLQAAKRKASRWLDRDDIVSVGIGMRLQEGDWRDEACIVIKTDWKMSAEKMREAHRRPLPGWIEVVVDGKPAKVRVDVQETGGALAGKLQSVIGSPVRCDEANIGSVSAIVRGTDPRSKKAILISGHVARHKGRRVELCGLVGHTAEPVRTSRLDHCLVEIDPEPAQCSTLLDGATLTGIREVKTLKLGETLYFHRMVTGMRVPLLLRQIDLSAQFRGEHGIQKMHGLLATDRRTAEGDSGALLHDEAFRAVGTLLGALAGESYFIPCDYAFAALGIQLA